MTPSKDRLEILYRKYAGNTCTQEELEEFFAYVRDPTWKETLETMADRQLETMEIAKDLPAVDWEHMYRTILPKPKKKPVRMFTRIAAAACFLLACIGIWMITNQRNRQAVKPAVAEKVIPPGYNKAILTLGDGSTIGLDSAHTGELARQGNVAVINAGNGSLTYDDAAKTGEAKVLYNTLTTPRGGQYQLTLPDGTKVWLNAASSITYPTAFTGNDRVVQMTGEAYFEVVHNNNKPFRVKTAQHTIEDIGTHFNVNAYTDEPAQVTTLLEGAVKIGDYTLKPGQQATETAGHIIVGKGDPAKAVAWKNGFFYFSDASLQLVMRQLSRWYNVEVVFEGDIRERQFNGMIGRTLTLSQVLRGLSREGVHYRIEANDHLIITP